jgi:hypothetical protein
MCPGPFGHVQDESKIPEEHIDKKGKHVVSNREEGQHQTGRDVGRMIAVPVLGANFFV